MNTSNSLPFARKILVSSLLPLFAGSAQANITGHSGYVGSRRGEGTPFPATRQVVVVDPQVKGYEKLLAGVPPAAEVIVLSGRGDGVAEMAAALASRKDIDSLYVISHGDVGQVKLGSGVLSASTLGRYNNELGLISGSLSDNGDLLLYGCHIGGGAAGAAFIGDLAVATGADVAASDDWTGSVDRGGDWELEVASGTLESNTLSEEQLTDFTGLLGLPPSNTQDIGPTTFTDNGNTVTNGYFVISGSHPVDIYDYVGDGVYDHAKIDAGSAGTGFFFYVAADGTNVDAFQLTRLWVGENAVFDAFTNVSVTGYLASGGTVTMSSGESSTNPGAYEDFGKSLNYTSEWLSGFKISFDSTDPATGTSGSRMLLFEFDANAAAPNSAPTDIALSSASVSQSGGANAAVGTLSSTDSDSSSFTYSLVAGSGDTHNGLFNINSDSLRANDAGALAEGDYNVRIETNDGSGGTYQEAFTITVADDVAPGVSNVTVSDSLLSESDVGAGAFTASVDFDDAMDTGVDPGFSFPAEDASPTLTLVSGSWSDNDTFVGTFDVADADQELAAIDLRISGGRDSAGNTMVAHDEADLFAIDTAAPNITAVSIPNTAMKVGDTVTVALTVVDDGGDTYSNLSGTVGGFALSNLIRVSSTSYTAQFTVSDGGSDVAASSDIPVNITLDDSAGNTSVTYSTPIIQSSDSIDANSPTVSGVSIPNAAMKVGDNVTVTITAGESGLSLVTGTVNGVAVTGYTDNGGGSYSATYTVQEGDTDRAPGDDIPVSFVLADAAGNQSAAYTSAISQGSDAIDANSPTLSDVSIPNAPMKVGDNVTVTITANEAGLSLVSGTVNGASLSDLLDNGDGTYSATYTVTEGQTDRAAGDDIPVSVTMADAAGNHSNTYTSALSQGADEIDANSPGTPTGTLSVDENSANGTAVGTVTGGGSDGVVYSLLDDAGGRFAIDGTGNVTVANASLLDYETATSHNITVRATDDAGNTTDAVLSVTINDLNEAPTIDLDADDSSGIGGNGYATTFSAGGSAVTIADSDAAIADADVGDQIESLTAALSHRPDGDFVESLSLTAEATVAASGLTVSYTSSTGILSITGAADAGTYQTILRGIQYENTEAVIDITTGDRTIEVVANDGSGDSLTAISTVSVVTAPVIDLGGDGGSGDLTVSYTEGDGTALVADQATVSEPDGDNINQLVIQLTNAQDGAAEMISLSGGSGSRGSISVSYDSDTQITLSGSDTAAGYQALLRELQYQNGSDDPDITSRIITVQGTDMNGNAGVAASLSVTMTTVNDAPILTATATNFGFTEDSPAVALFGGTAIDAVESDDSIVQLTLTLGNIIDGSDELLRLDGEEIALTDGTSGSTEANGFDYVVSLSGTTATVSLSKSDSAANWQALVDGLGYRNSSDAPDTTARTVTLETVRDSGGNANGGSDTSAPGIVSTVTITAVNDAPLLDPSQSPALAHIPANVTDVANTGTAVADMVVDGSISDPDGVAVEAVAVTAVDNSHGHWQYSTNGGTSWSAFTLAIGGVIDLGTDARLLGPADRIRFVPVTDWAGPASLSFVAWDMSSGSAGATADASTRGGSSAFSLDSDDAGIFVGSDLDGDGIDDSVDPDRDGDGIPNDWEEANGLDPDDPSDALEDADGDGLSNLDEYLADSDPNADDQPPVVTPPADLTVDAIGLFTEVSLGDATASDALDGAIDALIHDAPERFSPGRHIVTWSATDAAGNTGTAEQVVDVRPQASFALDEEVVEGGAATLRVYLNGPAAEYPVSIPFVVSGNADGSDHTLVDGTLTINSGLEGEVSFDLLSDGLADAGEQIVVEMQGGVNAVPGPRAVQTFTIVEGNLAPSVSLVAEQNGRPSRLVVAGNGEVTVTAGVSDPNSGDVHAYDWSGSDNALVDSDLADETFTFDPQALAPGFYTLALAVDDGTAGNTAQLTLQVVAAEPVLDAGSDSDGDGMDDAAEGYGDSDGDGVPDYLDAIDGPDSVLQTEQARADGFLLESDAGTLNGLGEVALRTGLSQARVTLDDVITHGGITADSGYSYEAGLYDFVVDGLPTVGQSVRVVIPVQSALAAGADYRQSIGGLWQGFVLDADNALASAAGAPGYCPPPGDSAYADGLNEGHWCVQLTIQDGGPNDADAQANGRVSGAGGVSTVTLSGKAKNPWKVNGGGATSPWQLLVLGSLLWLVRRRKLLPR